MIEITMPALSPTMTEGTLARWFKAPGDKVAAGEVIAEIETDKAAMEFEAADDGVLAEIIIPAGTEDVAVGTVIAKLAVGDDVTMQAKQQPQPQSPPPLSPQANIVAEPIEQPAIATAPIVDVPALAAPATPLARKLASRLHRDLAGVPGTGAGGIVLAKDLIDVSPQTPTSTRTPTPAPMAPAAVTTAVQVAPEGSVLIPHDGMRRTIAARLAHSAQTAPHIYLSVDLMMGKLLQRRAAINEVTARKISVTDFFVKACTLALRKVPGLNASFAAEGIWQHATVDIALAVAIPGGLITPVIQGADRLSLTGIADRSADLIARARARKLRPEEYQGGTFTISNLGMMGVRQFTAIINPPHSGILAVGATEERAIIQDGAIVPAPVATVTLSADHRLIDGALAAEFLAELKRLIEEPLLLLV